MCKNSNAPTRICDIDPIGSYACPCLKCAGNNKNCKPKIETTESYTCKLCYTITGYRTINKLCPKCTNFKQISRIKALEEWKNYFASCESYIIGDEYALPDILEAFNHAIAMEKKHK